jgi:hypothetical protein
VEDDAGLGGMGLVASAHRTELVAMVTARTTITMRNQPPRP